MRRHGAASWVLGANAPARCAGAVPGRRRTCPRPSAQRDPAGSRAQVALVLWMMRWTAASMLQVHLPCNKQSAPLRGGGHWPVRVQGRAGVVCRIPAVRSRGRPVRRFLPLVREQHRQIGRNQAFPHRCAQRCDLGPRARLLVQSLQLWGVFTAGIVLVTSLACHSWLGSLTGCSVSTRPAL